MRRSNDCIVSGQKLCQILTPALLAVQWFLSFQDKKFIRLAALFATVLINRHIFSFTLTDANTLPAYAAIFLLLKLILVTAFSLVSSACIVYRKLLKLVLT